MVSLDNLEKSTFCEGLPRDYVKRLLSVGHVKTCPAGTYLFHEGVRCEDVYLLGEGRVGLEVSLPDVGPVQVQTVGPGELLGWSPLLGLRWMTGSAVALTPCRVLALNAGRVLALAEGDPLFGMALMRQVALTLARRLEGARTQLLEAHRNEGQAVS
jgi:CRP-like cAMP-binding protein